MSVSSLLKSLFRSYRFTNKIDADLLAGIELSKAKSSLSTGPSQSVSLFNFTIYLRYER